MPDKIVLELTEQERNALAELMQHIRNNTESNRPFCRVNLEFRWSEWVALTDLHQKVQRTYLKSQS